MLHVLFYFGIFSYFSQIDLDGSGYLEIGEVEGKFLHIHTHLTQYSFGKTVLYKIKIKLRKQKY